MCYKGCYAFGPINMNVLRLGIFSFRLLESIGVEKFRKRPKSQFLFFSFYFLPFKILINNRPKPFFGFGSVVGFLFF